MKYSVSVAVAALLLFAFTLQADIGKVWVAKRTDTTIEIGYALSEPWRLTGNYRITASSQVNFTTEKQNKIENLKPNTLYHVVVEAKAQRWSGISANMYRQVGTVDVMTKGGNPADCPAVTWFKGSTKASSYDGANCFVADASKLGITFIHNNRYYLRPRTDSACPASQCTCPMGVMQGDRCFVRQKPPFGFIANNTFYMQATVKGECPLGGTFDGKGCSFGTAPAGTIAVEANGNFYTTRRPWCADGQFDGANCWFGDAPAGRKAFLHKGAFYFE